MFELTRLAATYKTTSLKRKEENWSMGEQRTRNEQQQQDSRSPLQTELGITTIQDGVVSKVAGIAAQEVEGVRMGGGTSQAVGSIMSAVPGVGGGSASQSRGVTVEVGEVEAAVDLSMSVEYGRAIPQVAEAVRTNVIRRVESLVGLRVTEVSITVNDIFFPQQEQQEQ
jgi:uncharacterized alkaline shock family protein YloU